MEHLVRVLNDHDRRVLEWARNQVGDAVFAEAVARCGPAKPYMSTVCRRLGLRVPAWRNAVHVPTATGEQSLAHIRHILAQRSGKPRMFHFESQAASPF